jgi:hypothetical protein
MYKVLQRLLGRSSEVKRQKSELQDWVRPTTVEFREERIARFRHLSLQLGDQVSKMVQVGDLKQGFEIHRTILGTR